MKTNASVSELYAALNAVNLIYSGNINFRKLETKGRRIIFTLTVYNSKAPGVD